MIWSLKMEYPSIESTVYYLTRSMRVSGVVIFLLLDKSAVSVRASCPPPGLKNDHTVVIFIFWLPLHLLNLLSPSSLLVNAQWDKNGFVSLSITMVLTYLMVLMVLIYLMALKVLIYLMVLMVLIYLMDTTRMIPRMTANTVVTR